MSADSSEWGEPREDRLLVVGEPVLRMRSRELRPEEIGTPAFRRLIEVLRTQMKRDLTVGLTAPQVGCSVRVLAVEVGRQILEVFTPARISESKISEVPFDVLVNPRITWRGTTNREGFEMCQSIPGYLGVALRAWEVRVEGLGADGQEKIVEATGFHARILQHEIDHLDGRLYIDSIDPRTFISREIGTDIVRSEPFAVARAKLLPFLA